MAFAFVLVLQAGEPGAGCLRYGEAGATFDPAGVTFTQQAPEVTVSSNQILADLDLACNDTSNAGLTSLEPSYDVRLATITGSPGPSACAAAVTRFGLSDQLHHDMDGHRLVVVGDIEPVA